jgi:hypothetical protein
MNAFDPKKGEEPSCYWIHRTLDLFRTNDDTRGIAIDKAEMLSAAAIYLSHPEIRTNRFDWMFLDSIAFAELDAFAEYVFTTRGGTGGNLAAAFAN